MMPLAILMNRELTSVTTDTTLRSAAEVMAGAGVGAVMVKENDAYEGIVSETDLVRKAMATGMNPDSTIVKQVMSSPLITIDINKTLTDANEIMSERGIRHLVVTQRGEVSGIISVRDLVIYFKNRL